MFNKLKSQVQAAVNEKVLKPLAASQFSPSASYNPEVKNQL